MKILVLNAGSSSLKYELFEAGGADEPSLLRGGAVERVSGWPGAIGEAFDALRISGDSVAAVGHRIVHGGTYPESAVVDEAVEHAIEDLCRFAPLHNPHGLAAYRAARERLPGAIHVAVFDTGFHQTMPPRAFAYAIPPAYLAEKRLRRYGFHGISHRSVALRFAQIRQQPVSALRLITCHLGNGCSVCAIEGGRSIDTSMGFTPLEGLVMGTRSGDMDASAVLHLIVNEREDPAALLDMLNNKSGLLALSGVSNDMRDVCKAAAAGNQRSRAAIEAFCYRVRKFIGAYLAAMGGADAVIFTGGIGENAAGIRAEICAGLDGLGIGIDAVLNAGESKEARRIGNSKVEVWVIPTEEGLLIARETWRWTTAFQR